MDNIGFVFGMSGMMFGMSGLAIALITWGNFTKLKKEFDELRNRLLLADVIDKND